MRKFFKEFKEFISRGSVIDLAVGIVVGTAFTAIVTSLVNDILMPLIVAIFGKGDVSELSVTLNNSVIAYGAFIQAIINFLLVSFFIFLIIKTINASRDLAEKGKSKRDTREEREERQFIKQPLNFVKRSKLRKRQESKLKKKPRLQPKSFWLKSVTC